MFRILQNTHLMKSHGTQEKQHKTKCELSTREINHGCLQDKAREGTNMVIAFPFVQCFLFKSSGPIPHKAPTETERRKLS